MALSRAYRAGRERYSANNVDKDNKDKQQRACDTNNAGIRAPGHVLRAYSVTNYGGLALCSGNLT